VHRLDLVASIESQEMPFQSHIEECSTELVLIEECNTELVLIEECSTELVLIESVALNLY